MQAEPTTTTSCSYALAEFRTVLLKGDRERRREAANHGMMDGTYYRQWALDQGAIGRMVQEGRAPTTINIIKTPINQLVGSILSDRYEASFEADYGTPAEEAEAIWELYADDTTLLDRDFRGWKHELMVAIRDGFIFRGTVRLERDYTINPMGRVRLINIPPDKVMYDPDWTTTNINENKYIWTFTYMSAKQIQDRWGKRIMKDGINVGQILANIEKRDAISGVGSAPDQVVLPFDGSPEYRDAADNTYLVINKYWLEQRKEVRIFDIEKAGFIDAIKPEDRERYVETARVVPKPDGSRYMLELVEDERYWEKVMTFCPYITTEAPLEEGDSDIQVGGYAFCAWSCDHLMGHPNTPVDQLTDPQRTINKREAWITMIMGTSASNAKLIEEGIVTDPTQRRKIEQGLNTPGFVGWVKDGSLQQNRIKAFNEQQPPNNFMAANNQMLKIAKEDLTPAVPAVQGVSESGESGVLYQAKVAQALIGLVVNKGFLQKFLDELHNKWFVAALQTYTYPMVVHGKKTGKVFYLNTENGIQVPNISRLNISTNEAADSQTRKAGMVKDFIAVQQYIPGPATRQKLSETMIRNLQGIPVDQLNGILHVSELESMDMELTLALQVEGKKQQLQAMKSGQPAPGQAPAAAPGLPMAPAAM